MALVGASVIAVAPIGQPLPDPRVEHLATRLLADTSSIANVPYNVIADIANIPYYESLALQEYAYALGPAGQTGGVPGWIPPGTAPSGIYTDPTTGQQYYALGGTGSWYMESMGNTWGWDNGNWPQLAAISGFLLPFQFTEPIAAQLQLLAQAELPDGSRVNCEFECADVLGYLGGWLSLPVPLTSLLSGTFLPINQTDTIGQNSPTGVINNGPPGFKDVAIWSGQQAALNPLVPFQAIAANLTQNPADNPIKFPNLADVFSNLVKLGGDLTSDFNPFVTGSFLYWGAPTLYSIPAALAGLVQNFTGIPNQFTNLPNWQPNGAEPLSGYTAGPLSLLTGVPAGFMYLAQGLLGYLNPSTYLSASLGNTLLRTYAAGSLPGSDIAKLLTGLGFGSFLTPGNSPLGTSLPETSSTGSPAPGIASVFSGPAGGALPSVVNNPSGTASTAPAEMSSPNTTASGIESPLKTAVPSGVGQTLDLPSSTPDQKPQLTTSTDVTVGTPTNSTPHMVSDGNRSVPGNLGGNSATSNGNSVGDRLSSAVSSAIGKLNGGSAKKQPTTHNK